MKQTFLILLFFIPLFFFNQVNAQLVEWRNIRPTQTAVGFSNVKNNEENSFSEFLVKELCTSGDVKNCKTVQVDPNKLQNLGKKYEDFLKTKLKDIPVYRSPKGEYYQVDMHHRAHQAKFAEERIQELGQRKELGDVQFYVATILQKTKKNIDQQTVESSTTTLNSKYENYPAGERINVKVAVSVLKDFSKPEASDDGSAFPLYLANNGKLLLHDEEKRKVLEEAKTKSLNNPKDKNAKEKYERLVKDSFEALPRNHEEIANDPLRSLTGDIYFRIKLDADIFNDYIQFYSIEDIRATFPEYKREFNNWDMVLVDKKNEIIKKIDESFKNEESPLFKRLINNYRRGNESKAVNNVFYLLYQKDNRASHVPLDVPIEALRPTNWKAELDEKARDLEEQMFANWLESLGGDRDIKKIDSDRRGYCDHIQDQLNKHFKGEQRLRIYTTPNTNGDLVFPHGHSWISSTMYGQERCLKLIHSDDLKKTLIDMAKMTKDKELGASLGELTKNYNGKALKATNPVDVILKAPANIYPSVTNIYHPKEFKDLTSEESDLAAYAHLLKMEGYEGLKEFNGTASLPTETMEQIKNKYHEEFQTKNPKNLSVINHPLNAIIPQDVLKHLNSEQAQKLKQTLLQRMIIYTKNPLPINANNQERNDRAKLLLYGGDFVADQTLKGASPEFLQGFYQEQYRYLIQFLKDKCTSIPNQPIKMESTTGQDPFDCHNVCESYIGLISSGRLGHDEKSYHLFFSHKDKKIRSEDGKKARRAIKKFQCSGENLEALAKSLKEKFKDDTINGANECKLGDIETLPRSLTDLIPHLSGEKKK